MEEQALPGEGEGGDSRGKRVQAMTKKLVEGLEQLERTDMKDCADFTKRHRERQNWREMLIWMKEEHASWERERESMEAELRKLRSEVEQLRGSRQICDVDRGSEEIDLKPLVEEKWIATRQALAPITPEAVRARTPFVGVSGVAALGKENMYSHRKSGEGAEEESERLRRHNKRLQEKVEKLTKENRSLKNQYHSVIKTRSGMKGDGGQVIPYQDDLQATLEKANWETPSKIRRHSPEEAQMEGGDSRTPCPVSPDTNAPSTPVPHSGILPPEAVSVVITGPAASTSGSRDAQANVKAEPVDFEPSKAIPQHPLTKKNSAESLGAGLKVEPDRTVDNSGMQHFPLLVGAVHVVRLLAFIVQSRLVSALGVARLLQSIPGFFSVVLR